MDIKLLTSRWTAVLCMAVLCTACAGADSRKASYLTRGEEYFAERNYDKARVEVRNALQIDPKFVAARYLAGRVAEKKGEVREAVGQYQAALDEDGKFNAARAALARLYMLGGLPDKALEMVEEGLKTEPDNAALLTVRAAVQAQKGRLVAAAEDAEAAYGKTPTDEYTLSVLASVYSQSARLDKAIEVIQAGVRALPKNVDLRIVLADLENSRKNREAVETQLKEVVNLEPEVLSHRIRLAQFYMSSRDVAAAEGVLRAAVKALPDKQDTKLALIDFLWSQRGEDLAMSEMQAMVQREPKNDDLKLTLGSYWERQQKLAEASALYQQVVERARTEPAGLKARNRLAALAVKNNEPVRAQQLIAEVLKENPGDNDALILRANLALQQGDASTAVTDLRTVLRDQPSSAPLLRALAQAHLRSGETALAEEALRSALQSNPGDLPTRKALAQLLLQQGKADQVRPLVEPLSTIQALGNDAEILDVQFRAEMLTKDFDAAQATAEKVQHLRPKQAAGWYYAGLVAEARQQRDVARKAYEAAFERQPDVAESLTALVRMDIADKQSRRALQRLDEVVTRNPQNAVAHNLRGELLLADKQWSPAQASFNKAIEHAPKWWTPYRGLALTQLGQKQNDVAVMTYERGIEATRAAALSSELAALHERSGKPDQAIKVYEQWVAREPRSQLAANNLSMLLLNYRQDKPSLERAAQLAETLVGSTDASMLDTRGWAKYRNGDTQGALNLLQQAASSSDSPTVRYHLGMAQLRNGDQASARDNLRAAVDSGKAFFGIEEAKNTLSQLSRPGATTQG